MAGQAAKRVLVVDDDAVVRSFIAGSLENRGLATTESGDIAEARRAASQELPDHVLTDLILADGKGMELVQWLRAQNPRVQVTFMSGYDEQSVRANEWIGQGDVFLAKPFSVTQLLASLGTELQPA